MPLQKVFRNGPVVIGYAGSFRIGQLLQYALNVPVPIPADQHLMRYMVVDFVDAVRECLKDGGAATTNDDGEAGGDFLVGVGGRLFKVHSDYQVGESVLDYAACGSGEDIALGALAATTTVPATQRVLAALSAAERHCNGVRAPFHTVTLPAASPVRRAA